MSTKTKKQRVTINREQRLYVIPCAGGYSCLGFDVLERRYAALKAELASLGDVVEAHDEAAGTLKRYAQWERLLEMGRKRNAQTGWRSKSELTPELAGLENKRVEVRHRWPSSGRVEVSRFYVGRSTGWMPCHLELARRNSRGGGAVCLGDILSVKVVGAR